MRIVNRATFLALPENTVFSKYKPCVFDEIAVKGETMGNDFVTQRVSDAIEAPNSCEFIDLLLRAEKTGESMKMDFDCGSRDGLFDAGQLFAVWEEADVRGLIELLKTCIK